MTYSSYFLSLYKLNPSHNKKYSSQDHKYPNTRQGPEIITLQHGGCVSLLEIHTQTKSLTKSTTSWLPLFSIAIITWLPCADKQPMKLAEVSTGLSLVKVNNSQYLDPLTHVTADLLCWIQTLKFPKSTGSVCAWCSQLLHSTLVLPCPLLAVYHSWF